MIGGNNRIADNPEQPLGEALMKLGASPLERTPTAVSGSDAFRANLPNWLDALRNYKSWLEGEIEVLEFQYHTWIPIWHFWRVRDRAPFDRRRWGRFIAESRRSRREEIAVLERKVAALASSTPI